MSDKFTSRDVARAQKVAFAMAAAACDPHAEQRTMALFAAAPHKALVVWHLALLVPRLARAIALGVGVDADVAGALEHMSRDHPADHNHQN
jgi:hypothetical protein